MKNQNQKYVFPINIKPGQTYFSDANHKPFLWLGDTCWRLFWEYTLEEAQTYLENRAKQGFSVIQVQLLPQYFHQCNRRGHKPFLVEGNLHSVNPIYFDEVEKFLQYGKKLGLNFAIAPIWLSSWEQDWYQYFHGQTVLDYSAFVAQRYCHLDNIIAWIHGGDDDALSLHSTIHQSANIYKQVNPNIAATYHAGISGGWEFFGDQNWFDFGMAYSYDKDDCFKQFQDFKSRYPDKPILLGESHYEGNEGISTETLRHYAYSSLILGNCGHTYGHKDIWMGTMFWAQSLCSAASHHMEVAKDIWDQLDWSKMQPDFKGRWLQTLRFKMPHASSKPIPTCININRNELVAYISDFRWFRSTQPVHKGKWIDPISGREKQLNWLEEDTLQIPGYNATGHTDWLLYLELKEVNK